MLLHKQWCNFYQFCICLFLRIMRAARSLSLGLHLSLRLTKIIIEESCSYERAFEKSIILPLLRFANSEVSWIQFKNFFRGFFFAIFCVDPTNGSLPIFPISVLKLTDFCLQIESFLNRSSTSNITSFNQFQPFQIQLL